MDNDDPIVKLLTEIRDDQRNDIESRKKAIADAARVQQRLVRTMTIALRILLILILGFVVVVAGGLLAK